MTDEERKKLLMPDPGAEVSADSLNSPDQQAAAASLLAGKFGPTPSALPGVDPSIAGAQAAAMMGPPKPYQQMGLGQQMNTPIPAGMPEAGGTLANLFENANRARTMSPGVTVQQPGGATLTADSAADYAKRINNVLDSAQALKAQDAAATNAGASPASVPGLGGPPAAAAPKDFNHYLEMITGNGGGPGWAQFAASPEERMAAAGLMHQDTSMQQQAALSGQHNEMQKAIEKMRIASAEKIAGMHFNPDNKDDKDVEDIVKQANTMRNARKAKGMPEDDANAEYKADLEANNIDPQTRKRVKPKTDVPVSPTTAVKKPSELPGASQVRARDALAQAMPKNALGIETFQPEALVAQIDKLKSDPNGMAALISKIKNTPDYEQKIIKPLLQQGATHALTSQSTNESVLKPFDAGAFKVQPDLNSTMSKAHTGIATSASRAAQWLDKMTGGTGEGDFLSSTLENAGRMITPGSTKRIVSTPGGRNYEVPEVPTIATRGMQSNDQHNQSESQVKKYAELIKMIEDSEKR